MTSRKPYRSRKPRTHSLTGKRSLGQNFLVDESMIDRIIAAFDPRIEDKVLEIGPGHGALTARLVDKVGKMFALEFDRDLAAALRERFKDRSNFTVIEDDALSVDYDSLAEDGDQLRLIANLPYNISTVILQRLFDVPGVFSDCVLMFQKEVVDRIIARPGTRDRGYLTVMSEAYFDVEHLFDVPPGAFQPAPKIWSSVIRLTPRGQTPMHPDEFRYIAGMSFAQKRKTLYNNLRAAVPEAEILLEKSGIDGRRRAETLTYEEWTRLVDNFVVSNPVNR